MFEVRGTYQGRPVDVAWDAGSFTGDPPAVTAIAGRIAAGDTVGLVPVGPFVEAAPTPAWVAILVARAVLDDVELVRTDEDLAAPNVDDDPGAVY